MPAVMPHLLEVAEGDLPAAGVAQDHVGQRQAEQRDPADRLERRRPAGGRRAACPGRGLRKLTGTSAGSNVAQLAEQLDALGDGLAHAQQHAAAQLHAVLAHQRQVSNRSSHVWVVTISAK